MRSGFGRGFPEHDPWLFDSRRLVESRETDCVLWISAYRAEAPGWQEAPPTIALTGHDAGFRAPPLVHIAVGRPGVDHAGVEHLSLTGTLAAIGATQPSDTISVADVDFPHYCRVAGSAAMLTSIAGGRVIDPANGRDGIGDVWMRDGRIIDAPQGARAEATYDAAGKIVMAGAIDIHSHIAGWNVNTARLLLPEYHRAAAPRPAATPLANAGWSTFDDRMPLCRHGLHHCRRAGGLAALCVARAP